MNPPAALHGAMTRDRKPFTYTPGGLDLSEIKSSRMAARLMRNAMNEGVPEVPKQSVQNTSVSTNSITVPNFNCLPVQVFPTFNLPANPKSLLRTRSNPAPPRDLPVKAPPPTAQFVNNTMISGPKQSDTFYENTPTISQMNNNRPASMYEYGAPANTYSTNYSNDFVLPEMSYDAEYFRAPPRNTQGSIMHSNELCYNNNNVNKDVNNVNKTSELRFSDECSRRHNLKHENKDNNIFEVDTTKFDRYCDMIYKPETDNNEQNHIEIQTDNTTNVKGVNSNNILEQTPITNSNDKIDDGNVTIEQMKESNTVSQINKTILPDNSENENFQLALNYSTFVPDTKVAMPHEDHESDENKKKEIKTVEKQVIVKNENGVESHNGSSEQIGDSEVEAVIKLPTKKSAAKTETKVEVTKKTLPDGSIEEIKKTITKTTIDGKTEIKTKTETTIIPKDDDEEEEVEEVEEEEENEESQEEKVDESKITECEKKTEESTRSNENGHENIIKTEERSETTTTSSKKIVVVQDDEDEQKEDANNEEEEVDDESEPVTFVIKQPVSKPEESQKEEVEEVSEEEENEVVEVVTEEATDEIVKKEAVNKQEDEKEEVEEEVEEEEEYEEAEEKQIENDKENDNESAQKDNEKSEPVDKDVEPEEIQNDETQFETQQVVENEIANDDKEEQKQDITEEKQEVIVKNEEIKEEKPNVKEEVYTIKVEQVDTKENKVPLREPSVPLEKVEEVEIKPIGLGDYLTRTSTEKTEIITRENVGEKPLGLVSEINRIENIVTVNRSTKTLDRSYEDITQQGIPTLKTYFTPHIDKMSTSPQPAKPYQPAYTPEPTTERRHSLLLERLSVERQMPTDVYQSNYQYSNQTIEQQKQWSQEPQAEVLTVSNVKPSQITNQQWYQQKENAIYNNVTPSSQPAPPATPSWSQPKPQPQPLYQPQPQYQTPQTQYHLSQQSQYQPPPQPQYQPPAQPQYQPSPQSQYQPPSQPQYQAAPQSQYRAPTQSQYQPTYSDNVHEKSSSTYQSSYSSYTPQPTNWASKPLSPIPTIVTPNQPSPYSSSYLSKDSSESYQKTTHNYSSSSYVPPPWEQDSTYVAPESVQNYQPPLQTSTFSPSSDKSWKSNLPTSKFSKPPPKAYIPPKPNQSFVAPVSNVEPPRIAGRKTYYSEYERRFISVPETTYVPGESKFQHQPDPSPAYYYDNNEPVETVEPQWRRELREFTEKSQTQTTTESNVRPPWESETKFAKTPEPSYTSTPTWSQTVRPQSWRERSFESEFVSQEWPKTNTLGRGRPLSSYGKESIPERTRGVSVDRYNPNSYQAPVAAEHPPVQTHTHVPPAPHATGYHNSNVPAYHARASAEPREQVNYQQPRNLREARASPFQSRSFKYLQWITGTED